MSEGGDVKQMDTEQEQQQQQQPVEEADESCHELSDDNPIENDVEHTPSVDELAAAGCNKSMSADSGAEIIGSPDQHVTGSISYETWSSSAIPDTGE